MCIGFFDAHDFKERGIYFSELWQFDFKAYIIIFTVLHSKIFFDYGLNSSYIFDRRKKIVEALNRDYLRDSIVNSFSLGSLFSLLLSIYDYLSLN